jgi:hypothetical protein|nr:MAG TPA: hypothetical protein [Caudoviricetes sp.]
MRLIDVDTLKKDLKSVTLSNGTLLNTNTVLLLLDKYPTAYDVDKVVEQLGERSKEYNSGVRLHGKPEEMLTDEAIEIVKAGGNA